MPKVLSLDNIPYFPLSSSNIQQCRLHNTMSHYLFLDKKNSANFMTKVSRGVICAGLRGGRSEHGNKEIINDMLRYC